MKTRGSEYVCSESSALEIVRVEDRSVRLRGAFSQRTKSRPPSANLRFSSILCHCVVEFETQCPHTLKASHRQTLNPESADRLQLPTGDRFKPGPVEELRLRVRGLGV